MKNTSENNSPEPRIVRLRWDDPKWWPCRCPRCGWEGMSNETAGGTQIADTGDYDDPVCPVCVAPGGDYKRGHWIPVQEIPVPNDTSTGLETATQKSPTTSETDCDFVRD